MATETQSRSEVLERKHFFASFLLSQESSPSLSTIKHVFDSILEQISSYQELIT